VAGGCAFVVIILLARVLFSLPTLPELVQDRLVLLLPGPAFSFALDRLRYLGKPLLFGVLLLLLTLVGGLGGVAMSRMRRAATLPVLAWIAIGLAILPLAGAGVFAGSVIIALVNLLACAAYGLAFRVLYAPSPPSSTPAVGVTHVEDVDPGNHAARYDRRRLLAGAALGIAAIGLAWRAAGRLSAPPAGAASTVPSTGPGGTPASPLAVDSLSAAVPPAVTPSERFYVVSKNLFDPDLDADKWGLRIDGIVDRPRSLRFGDIAALPSVRAPRTLECISNEVGGDLISNGLWTGTRLGDLLREAGVRAAATHVLFTCADGFTSSLTLTQATDPSILLAYQLDDAPLPKNHGFPVRVLGTATYGMKNPKWVTRIEVASANRPGFWQQQGWDEQAIVQTMSVVTAPDNNATVSPGTTPIGGIAFAGDRGVTRVEVSTDAGSTWTDAELLPSLGPSTWTLWRLQWRPEKPGSYLIVVRATDGTGAVQPARRTTPFPVGATGYHQVHVRVAA